MGHTLRIGRITRRTAELQLLATAWPSATENDPCGRHKLTPPRRSVAFLFFKKIMTHILARRRPTSVLASMSVSVALRPLRSELLLFSVKSARSVAS